MMKPILLLIALLGVSGCESICTEKHLGEVKSPDGKYVATLFERDCGATARFAYHVNVRDESSSYSRDIKGAILDGEVFVTERKENDMRWEDDKTLRIECNSCTSNERFYLEKSWKDIQILYKPKQR